MVLFFEFIYVCCVGIVQGALKTEKENRNALISWTESWMLIQWEI